MYRKNGGFLEHTRIHSTVAMDDWHDDDMGGRVVLLNLTRGDNIGRKKCILVLLKPVVTNLHLK